MTALLAAAFGWRLAFVVPGIALLHGRGGFPLVLGAAAGCGAVIWLAALAFRGLARAPAGLAPAE